MQHLVRQQQLAAALGSLAAKGLPVHRLAGFLVAQLQTSLLTGSQSIDLLEALCKQLPLGAAPGAQQHFMGCWSCIKQWEGVRIEQPEQPEQPEDWGYELVLSAPSAV